ncbi:arginyltransferase [Roseiconus lacunae]|uniref:Arginyltransferase n=1 Tax=Roseiconus lacunae TaxID=2605694 RepID=A0ABT7PPU4_9BACT|nr:arginyltransferase [Roseiconus lacunae]MCD0462204.1 arginyltransferase [Roseiconus lacunae]MDM4018512.1 arginyltransferase [Roseiconus lacunae]
MKVSPLLASFFMDREHTPITPPSAAADDSQVPACPTVESSGSIDVKTPSASANTPMVVIYNQTQSCPYLDGQVARMPLEHPVMRLEPAGLDDLLVNGYRRTGPFFYRTQCPSCRECIPVRVDVNQFRFSSSMRRIINRCDRELRVVWGTAKADPIRLDLFNRHRSKRELTQNGPSSLADYHEFLVATSVNTAEIALYRQEKLIGVAITDVAANSLNAVYTHFDPDFAKYSIGTLAILLQFKKALETNRRYVYLGLYVADNSHLNYKRRFQPQQWRVDGQWVTIAAK